MITATQRERKAHQLLLAARGGDALALRSLVQLCGPRMWRVAAALTDSRTAAQLVSKAVACAVSPEVSVPNEGDTQLDLLRHLCQLAWDLPADAHHPLAALSKEQRACLVLTQLGELTDQQTAKIFHTDVDQVEASCRAARQTLAARLPTKSEPVWTGIQRRNEESNVPVS